MAMTDLDVEGPDVDERSEEQRYTVHAEWRDVHFTVIPETLNGESGWGVRIEGIPEPSIVHDRPWTIPEDARDAALRAIRPMLDLELMQIEEQRRGSPKEILDEEEPEETV